MVLSELFRDEELIMSNRLFLFLTIIAVSASSSAGQKNSGGKFNDAIKRSKASAEIITMAAQVSPNGIPKELLDQAAAIGVFPCKKTDLLIEHAVICPGAIVSRTQNGWSLPAFFRFFGGGFGRPDPALGQSNAIILLFMAKQPVDWLSTLRNAREAIAGPLGSLTEEQKSELVNARVIAYALRKDSLSGETLKSGFWKSVGVVEDNKINKPLYGMKGREVLTGREINSASLPAGISAFREALQKYRPVP
jgi:lipid-binding SYLF domain-containing protein